MSTINPLARPSTGSLRPQDIPGTGIEEHGEPGLGTLLRHLTDLLDEGSEAHYRAAGLSMRARYTPVLRALGDSSLSVMELTARAGITQGAVSQTVKLMEADELIQREETADGRSRAVRLTSRGQALRAQLMAHWRARFVAIEALEDEIGIPLRAALAKVIEALEREDFATRIARVEDSPNRRERSRA